MEQQLSLWGNDFSIPDTTKKVLEKIEKPKDIKKVISSKKTDISEKLMMIEAEVNRILGKYKEDTICIRTKDELVKYIDKAIENKIIAIDTETNNSLDPITCKIMGGCIYTPGMKNAYIPINHVNRETDELLPDQLTEQDLFEQFSRLGSVGAEKDIEIITHNGKFDYEVLYCTTGWKMPVTWDTMIGARLLNENERAGLKEQYRTKIDPLQEKYDIENLFAKLEYAVVDPALFALYAATDSYITYRLYEYQKKEFENPDLARVYKLYKEIEMPVMFVSAQMELDGICFDMDYCNRLKKKYYAQLDKVNAELTAELTKLAPTITAWRDTEDAKKHTITNAGKEGKSKAEQLKATPELTSPTQLAILLYDILKCPVVDKKTPRGTGSEILKELADNYPICKQILKQRELLKLINAFLESLPEKVCPKDGRLHSHFNQLGTDTGRFSCTEPNLQQIPSHNPEIRLLFKAQPGYTLVGSDYSQQEPRLLTAYSEDPKFLDAYKNGKDMYATMGTGVYKNDYWDNMEHHEDGTPNVEGKKRRKKMKTLLLGMMYGMGPNLLATKMNVSKEEAEQIINDFYTGFPQVQKWMHSTEENASKTGYVEDFWGRRRRLPDLQLPKIEVKYSKFNENAPAAFNPILGSNGTYRDDNDKELLDFKKRADNCKYRKELDKLKVEADKKGIYIKDNSGFISTAQRQCVNARIQGGAATMTKKAMIAISKDKEINDLGFHILIGVHDELIGECPKENADKVAERLTTLMKTAVPELAVPFKCDAEIEEHWYQNEYTNTINDDYHSFINEDNLSEDEAFKKICEEHSEYDADYLRGIIE